MSNARQATLVRLGDTNLTVADPAEDIRGRKVRDRHGEEIGDVDSLLLDEREAKVRFLEVGAGGFLGIGEKKFLVPVDAITRVDSEHVHIDQTREHVIGAPEYDPELIEVDDYYNDVYGYYGYAPFWGPGYVYPGFPHYPMH